MGRGEEISKKADIILSLSSSTTSPFISGDDIRKYYIKDVSKYISNQDVKKNNSILYLEKIVVRQVGKNISASYDNLSCITPQSVYSIIPNNNKEIPFILGLLNSKLFDFIYQKKYNTKKVFPRILLENLKQLPIPQSPDPIHQSQLVKLVETMLQLNKDLQIATLPEQKEHTKARIDYTDKKIDKLVYELYGLTEDEIKIVEGE